MVGSFNKVDSNFPYWCFVRLLAIAISLWPGHFWDWIRDGFFPGIFTVTVLRMFLNINVLCKLRFFKSSISSKSLLISPSCSANLLSCSAT